MYYYIRNKRHPEGSAGELVMLFRCKCCGHLLSLMNPLFLKKILYTHIHTRQRHASQTQHFFCSLRLWLSPSFLQNYKIIDGAPSVYLILFPRRMHGCQIGVLSFLWQTLRKPAIKFCIYMNFPIQV